MSQHNRSFSVLFGVGSAAFLALPIALTTYVGTQRTAVEQPSFHSSAYAPDYGVTPISERKALAVHEFKTAQI